MIVDPGLLWSFLLLSAVLSLTPGPSVVLSTGRAITQGRAPALRIVLGNALGGAVLLGLVIAGLGAVVATVAPLFAAIKIAGAAYLCYLGVRSLLALRSSTTAADLSSAPAVAPATRREIREGFLVGVANPKSIISLMAILPQFVDPEIGSTTMQMVVIGLTGGVAQLLIETFWVLAANGFRAWFGRRPRRIATLKAVGGAAMIGLAAKLLVERPAT